MNSPFSRILSLLLRYALGVSAVVFLFAYGYVVLQRVSYPFELEWMEGAMVDHVARILDSQPLYAAPSVSFIPFVYPPLFFYVSAAVANLVGLSFVPLRLVSIVSSLGCFVLIYFFVKREGSVSLPAFFAAALYAATYKLCDTYFDIGRADSLFLFLLLMSAYVLRSATTTAKLVISGILLSLAYFTKQSALVAALPLSAYSIWTIASWRRWIFPVTIFTIVGSTSLLLNATTEGWFRYYVFDLPSQAPLRAIGIPSFWRRDILSPLPITFGCAILFLLYQLKERRKEAYFYLALFLGLICCSWLPRMIVGGWVNNNMPAYAAIAILSGLFFHAALSYLRSSGNDDAVVISVGKNRIQIQTRTAETLLHMFLLFQIIGLAYNPLAQIPTNRDNEAGHKFIRMMRDVEGDIYIPSHGRYAAMAGKPAHVHDMGIEQIFTDRDTMERHTVEQKLVNAFATRKFSVIVFDGPALPFLDKVLKENYSFSQKVFESDSVFFLIAGAKIRPTDVYVANK
jgi:4-amino-4-deoxy-L-arabinose transferase-like glycosyltransferase